MKQIISIGNEIQVYNKGEAYSGCLVAFGKVVEIEEDLSENLCYEIEGFEGSFNEDEYDIVHVSLMNPFFASRYGSSKN